MSSATHRSPRLSRPEEASADLDHSARATLLAVARDTLLKVVHGLPQPAPELERLSPATRARKACFVTLTKRGSLRGCIGTLSPEAPLASSVAENTANAALRDSRFEPVRPEELAEIRIEISVLGDAHELSRSNPDDPGAQLIPFRHGVILESGDKRATFLPQVWEKFPDKTQFLDALARKAGFDPGEWRRPAAHISVYEAECFREEDPAGRQSPG